MKDIYELLNDIDIDENEFEEMKVSEIEKARIKKRLKQHKTVNNTLSKENKSLTRGIFYSLLTSNLIYQRRYYAGKCLYKI